MGIHREARFGVCVRLSWSSGCLHASWLQPSMAMGWHYTCSPSQILVCSGCHNKWVASTRETYLLTVLEAEIQGQGVDRFGFSWGLPRWLTDGKSSHCVLECSFPCACTFLVSLPFFLILYLCILATSSLSFSRQPLCCSAWSSL